MTDVEFRLEWIKTCNSLKSKNKDLSKYKIGCIDKTYQDMIEREIAKQKK